MQWHKRVSPSFQSTEENNKQLKLYSLANYTGESGLPWWAVTVLLIIGFVFCALYSLLNATIGFQMFITSLNGFFQMITAYMVPGRPVAFAVTWGERTTTPGCRTPRTVVPAGSYRLMVRLDDLISPPTPFIRTP